VGAAVRLASESVPERRHQPAKTGNGLFHLCHFQRVPDVGLAACDHGLTDLAFQQIHVGDRGPAGWGSA